MTPVAKRSRRARSKKPAFLCTTTRKSLRQALPQSKAQSKLPALLRLPRDTIESFENAFCKRSRGGLRRVFESVDLPFDLQFSLGDVKIFYGKILPRNRQRFAF